MGRVLEGQLSDVRRERRRPAFLRSVWRGYVSYRNRLGVLAAREVTPAMNPLD